MMLRIKMLSFISLFSVFCFAQPSNKYNSKGAIYAGDLNKILPELQNLKLSDLNQEKIDKLKQGFRTEIELTESQLANYVTSYKSDSKDDIINKTKLSLDAKGFLKRLSNGENNYATYDFDLINNEINTSKISENEKEILLTISAIQYNLLLSDKNVKSQLSSKDEESGCDVTSVYPPIHHTPVECGLLLGGVLAGVAGGGCAAACGICGLPCAAGGFVVGFVIGYFSTK